MKSHAPTYMSQAQHLEISEDDFLMLTKAKIYPKNLSKEKLTSPFYLCPWLLNLVFFMRTLCLNSGLNTNIYFSPCLAVLNNLKWNSANHQCHVVIVSIQFLPCASAAHEYNYLPKVSVTDLLITTKAFTLYINFPVATGNMQESAAGIHCKKSEGE